MKNNYAVEKQTHDLPNRIRNHTSLLVLATWTLGDHVAPEQELVKVMMMVTETHLIALIK